MMHQIMMGNLNPEKYFHEKNIFNLILLMISTAAFSQEALYPLKITVR